MLVRLARRGINSSKSPPETSSSPRLDLCLVDILTLVNPTISDLKRSSWLGYYVTVLTIEKLGRKFIQLQGFLMEALFCKSPLPRLL